MINTQRIGESQYLSYCTVMHAVHNMDQRNTQKRDRLRQARIRASFSSAAEAARSMGMVQSTYTSHENGTRDFDEYDAVRYARRFKVSKEWLLFGTTESDAEIPPDALPVLGEVRAGAWLEMDGEQSPSEYLPLTSDPMYRRARQYALRVVGTSMNKIIDPGAFVIVADWSDLGKMPEQDELVIVKRQRGSTVECTVKRAKRTDDGWELWPESTDPRWQEPIRLVDGGLDDEVQIIGKVIGKYDRLI